jgi:LmbE family N-acetylglucosaminyl deacetylase
MLRVNFKSKEMPLEILCIGSHSDDIEIGCGGSIIRLLGDHTNVSVTWVVLAGGDQRSTEAAGAAEEFLTGARTSQIKIEDFKDGFFPYKGEEIKLYFEMLKDIVSPDIIFTHYRNDLHQDHRLVSDLTWNTFRDHLILEYEIIKYDGDIGVPNLFVHLNENICSRKIDILMKHHQSQAGKDWFTPDTFWSVMRLRGIEGRSTDRYAEAFHVSKLVY